MLAVSERFTNVHDNLFGRLNQPQRNWFFTAMIAQRTAEYKLNQIALHCIDSIRSCLRNTADSLLGSLLSSA